MMEHTTKLQTFQTKTHGTNILRLSWNMSGIRLSRTVTPKKITIEMNFKHMPLFVVICQNFFLLKSAHKTHV